MKVYLVFVTQWHDSDDYDCIAYEVDRIFDTEEKAKKYAKKVKEKYGDNNVYVDEFIVN